MHNFVTGANGWIHLLASILALATGAMVLAATKGTQKHKQTGYVYAASMVVVNVTAFMIYRLFGGFGIFHALAIVSGLTLVGGLYPLYSKKGNYLITHFSFMYWSVIGLYGALVAEVFSRLPRMVLDADGRPMTIFYQFIGIGTAMVMGAGVYGFIKYRPVWTKQFGENVKTSS